jgi:DNA-binding HxlR family transcriptional regulator
MKDRSSSRKFPQECPLEECLRVLAGAWTPQVLWYLHDGPRRFGELKRAIPGVSAKVLTTRLRELEERGVLARRVLPTSPPSIEYRLTDLGAGLEPVLEAIAAAGAKLKQRSAPRRALRRPVAAAK